MRSSAATSKVTAGDVWDFNPFNPFNCHERQQKMIVSIEWVTKSCHIFVTPLKSNDDVAEFQGIEIISNCDGYYSISFFNFCQMSLPTSTQIEHANTDLKNSTFFLCQNADMDEFQTLETSTSPSAARSKSMYSMPQMKKNAGIQRLKPDHCHHCFVFALSSNLPEKSGFKAHILIQEAFVQEEAIGTLMRRNSLTVCFLFLWFLVVVWETKKHSLGVILLSNLRCHQNLQVS